MPGIRIDLHHNLREGAGGDPRFAGVFHGAGSGGAELVDEHATGLAKQGARAASWAFPPLLLPLLPLCGGWWTAGGLLLLPGRLSR